MTSPPSEPARASFFRFGVADFLFLFFTLAILQRASFGMVDDPGLGWQLRIPDAMIEQGGFLYTDPFGRPTHGQPWIPYGFLGSTALRLAWGWGGLEGLAMLTALTVAFIVRCLYRMMIVDGVPAIQALFWAFLAALGISSGWVARPNLFTFLFFLVTIRVCVQWHRGRISRNRTLWLIPLFLIWANTHGGFAAGLVTIAVAGIVELLIAVLDPTSKQQALARFRGLFVVGMGCVLATLVTPYGPRLHMHILRGMSDPYMMSLTDDWLSMDFHLAGAFRVEMLILLLPLLLAGSKCRPDWVSLALVILWLHFALNGRRYAPLWVLAAVPLLARLAMESPLVERFGAWLNETRPDLKAVVRTAAGPAPWFWSVILAVGLMTSTHFVKGYARHNPEIIPSASLDILLQHYQGETTFHSINWGGYLTWHGWDHDQRFLVWIDDRYEIYGRQHTEEWSAISNALPGWREKLQMHDIRLIAIETGKPLAQRLQSEPDSLHWEKLNGDQYAVIFRRKD